MHKPGCCAEGTRNLHISHNHRILLNMQEDVRDGSRIFDYSIIRSRGSKPIFNIWTVNIFCRNVGSVALIPDNGHLEGHINIISKHFVLIFLNH